MNEQQQQELNERIADDERIATVARKAYDYDALAARVEAAEAEAARLRDENAEAWFALDRQQSRGDRLAARVAELEALAAQGWRPLGAPPASTGEYLTGADYIPDVRLAEYHADTDMWYQQLPDGEWQLADWATHWRPLPPAPQETE